MSRQASPRYRAPVSQPQLRGNSSSSERSYYTPNSFHSLHLKGRKLFKESLIELHRGQSNRPSSTVNFRRVIKVNGKFVTQNQDSQPPSTSARHASLNPRKDQVSKEGIKQLFTPLSFQSNYQLYFLPLPQTIILSPSPNQHHRNQQEILSHLQSTSPQTRGIPSLLEENNTTCSAAKTIEHEVDSFLRKNEAYFKHTNGNCLCTKCSCGKHHCTYARSAHLKQPFNPSRSQTIYQIHYIKKESGGGIPETSFNYGMYNNLKANKQPIDHRSTNQVEYTKPDASYCSVPANFKPQLSYEANTAELGQSHYKRNFLEWGCSPYQPVRSHSLRTTIDAMPFHGTTTYSKDYMKQPPSQSTSVKPVNKNHTKTIGRSPIPFLGLTTSQEFYKPYKTPERAVQYIVAGELFTGAPSFHGQYHTLHNKVYINHSKAACPAVSQDLTLSAQSVKVK